MASVNLACVRSRGRYSQVTVGREIAPRQDLSREIAPRGRATRSLSSAEAKQRRPWLAGGGTCRRAYIHLGACEIEVQVSLKILGTLCRAAVWREPGARAPAQAHSGGVRCPPTPFSLVRVPLASSTLPLSGHQRSLRNHYYHSLRHACLHVFLAHERVPVLHFCSPLHWQLGAGNGRGRCRLPDWWPYLSERGVRCMPV